MKKTLPKGHNINMPIHTGQSRETTVASSQWGIRTALAYKSNDAYRFMDILRYIYADVMALVRDNAVYRYHKRQAVPSAWKNQYV